MDSFARKNPNHTMASSILDTISVWCGACTVSGMKTMVKTKSLSEVSFCGAGEGRGPWEPEPKIELRAWRFRVPINQP